MIVSTWLYFLACSNLYPTLSTAITLLAPLYIAHFWANKPTGPDPKTTTVSFGFTSAISTPQSDVGKISVKNKTCSSVSSSGIIVGPTFA